MRRDREDEFDLADVGGNAHASTHNTNIGHRGRPPKDVDKDTELEGTVPGGAV